MTSGDPEWDEAMRAALAKRDLFEFVKDWREAVKMNAIEYMETRLRYASDEQLLSIPPELLEPVRRSRKRGVKEALERADKLRETQEEPDPK